LKTQSIAANKKSDFYRDHYHHVLWGLMTIILFIAIAAGVLLEQLLHRPLPVFAAKQTTTGEILELMPYDEPNMLAITILKWASKAAVAAYTFDYLNYKAQIAAVRPYFTETGWKDYQQSVQELINSIVQNQLFVNSVVVGTPIISNQGPLPDIEYAWRVQIPFLVTYQSGSAVSKRNFYVVLNIIKIPTTENPQGIGIDQFVMV